MVAKKYRPLTGLWNLRRLLHYLDDGMPVLLGHCHVHAGHEREVIRHMTFVAVAEVLTHVLRPLVRLGEEHPVVVVLVHHRTHPLDDLVGLLEILVIGAFTHAEVGNCIEAQAVDAQIEPEAHDANHGLHDLWIIVIQIRLVGEKAVPVVSLRERIPGPVGRLGVREDDTGFRETRVGVAPDVVVALRRARSRAPRRLKPRMLIGGVIDHQLGNDLEPAVMRFTNECSKIPSGAVIAMDIAVVGNVVAVIAQR